jgi:hypothetical protein
METKLYSLSWRVWEGISGALFAVSLSLLHSIYETLLYKKTNKHNAVIGSAVLTAVFRAGFLFGFLFSPENGGDIFLRNVSWLWTEHRVLYSRIQNSSEYRYNAGYARCFRNYVTHINARHFSWSKHVFKGLKWVPKLNQGDKHKCDAWLLEEQMNKRRQEGKTSTWLLEQGVNKTRLLEGKASRGMSYMTAKNNEWTKKKKMKTYNHTSCYDTRGSFS